MDGDILDREEALSPSHPRDVEATRIDLGAYRLVLHADGSVTWEYTT